MEKVEAVANGLEAVFERVNEIVAISQWQTCECEATVGTLLEHMTAAVHMGCLMPPPYLLECKHSPKTSSTRAFVALGANWAPEDEPQSCGQDTWLCGVIPQETGESVSSSLPISKAEVKDSTTQRNSTDKASSDVPEVPAIKKKQETVKTNAVPREHGKGNISEISGRTLEQEKPKVKRMKEDTKNKKDGKKTVYNAATKTATQNISKPRGIASHSTKGSGITNTKRTKHKTQSQGLKKEATKTNSTRREPQASSSLSEVAAADSKNLNCDKAPPETTPCEPKFEETKQDEKLPAVKHCSKRTTTRIPCSFISRNTQTTTSRLFASRRKPQMGVSTNHKRNHKSHDPTHHIGKRPSKIPNQSGTILTDGFIIPTDDCTNTAIVLTPTALPRTRRPTSADRRAASKQPIPPTERNGVVVVGRTHHVPRERYKVSFIQRRDVTCV